MERYKPLVRAQAASYYLPGADAEDLVQEGMIGLFRAIQDFDPAKGAFGSFASCACKGGLSPRSKRPQAKAPAVKRVCFL